MGKRETTAKHHTWQSISIKYYSNVNALKRLLRSTSTNPSQTHNFSPLQFFSRANFPLTSKKFNQIDQKFENISTSWSRSINSARNNSSSSRNAVDSPTCFEGREEDERSLSFTSRDREPSIARTTLKMHAGCVTRDEIRGSANFGNESKRASSQPRVCSKFQSLRGEMLSDVNVWCVRREREQRSVLSFDRFSKRSIDDIARAS